MYKDGSGCLKKAIDNDALFELGLGQELFPTVAWGYLQAPIAPMSNRRHERANSCAVSMNSAARNEDCTKEVQVCSGGKSGVGSDLST